MPKAYWIARVDVRDPESYKDYVATARPAFEQYGARFIVRGGTCDHVEGEGRGRNVVIEFASMDDARACYHSDQYQKAAAIRQKYADGEIVLVEGVDA